MRFFAVLSVRSPSDRMTSCAGAWEVIVVCFLSLLFFSGVGCESVGLVGELPMDGADNGFDGFSAYIRYNPVKLEVMPLTEFSYVGDEEGASGIKIYVSVLDSFGCQVKTPGVFRFELYERVERFAEPKGRRVVIWPDVDLIDAAKNNEHWRDFLRAYEFNLDFEPRSGRDYILQVTCLCPNGRRLWGEFVLKQES